MQKIKDPMISCNGEVYSLAGLKLLLAGLTNGVCCGEKKIVKGKKRNGKI